ncbi:MAG: dipeptidase [Candidatus Dadabacteria bacterium]|jgi:membrane dipeptidase|nr:MAG: membrane dipeptidase [Thermodesulfobacteriales bacterium]
MSKNFLIIDAHEDIAFHLNYFKRDFVNPDMPCMITLPWLKEGNVRMVFNTVFIHPKHKPDKTVQSGLDQLSKYEEIYKTFPNDVYQILKAEDLTKFGQDSKIGFLTLIEGADPIESVSKLDEFYDRGVRVIGPAWNNKNQYASGNESEDGLSQEGIQLIKRMNELGITLDLSHLNEKCFWESIELTDLIPIATHSNARALTDHPRNLGDEQLKAISDRGGVIGIVLYNYFLKIGDNKPTLEDVFAHADYMINLCGEDHVGIGSDMDGARIEDFPQELKTIADLPKIAQFFIDKGYSQERVTKIMSGNFLRVLQDNL